MKITLRDTFDEEIVILGPDDRFIGPKSEILVTFTSEDQDADYSGHLVAAAMSFDTETLESFVAALTHQLTRLYEAPTKGDPR